MRYNMPMHDNRYLLDLIAGQRPAVKAASIRHHTLEAALLRSMTKQAQQIVGARLGPSRHTESIRAQQAARAQAAQQAAAARAAKDAGKTGYEAYDNLPDVVKRRRDMALKARKQQFLNQMPGRKPKTQEQINKELDANGPTKSWGDSRIGQGIARAVSAPITALFSGVLGAEQLYRNIRNGRPMTEGVGQAMKDFWNKPSSAYRDVANNFQLQAENLRHGAETIGRAVTYYGDKWGSKLLGNGDSMATQKRLQNMRASWDDATRAHMERSNRIVNNFQDDTLKHPERAGNYLGMLNYGANAAVGEFEGGELATAGIGGVAKGVGKGMTAATRATASGAGNMVTRGLSLGRQTTTGLNSAGELAGTGARTWTQHAGGMVQRGINAMGDTLAMPARAVGTMATPITTTSRAVPQALRGGWQTVRAGVGRPIGAAWNFAHHPLQSMRSTVMHPWQAARGVGRWGRDTFSPAWNMAMGNTGLQAQAMYGLATGDGGAGVGGMGAYGALGGWALPAMLVSSMYGGQGDGGQGDDGQYQEQGY